MRARDCCLFLWLIVQASACRTESGSVDMGADAGVRPDADSADTASLAGDADSHDDSRGCPPGSWEDHGRCRYPCPTAWQAESDDEYCRPPCPDGWFREDGDCILPCPVELEQAGPLCYPPFTDPLTHCNDADYNPEGSESSDTVIYVHQQKGGPFGDGSEENPFADLPQVIDILPDGEDVSILLGPGEYTFPNFDPGPSAIRMLGTCAEEVTFLEIAGVTLPDTTVEVARVSLGNPIDVYACMSLILRQSVLTDDGYVMWSGDGSLQVEGNRFEASWLGVWILAGEVEGHIMGNEFNDAKITLDDFQSVEISGNRFVDGQGPSIEVTGIGYAGDLLIVDNWFESITSSSIRLSSCMGKTELLSNSFLDIQGTAIDIASCSEADLDGNRVSQTAPEPAQQPAVKLFDIQTCRIAQTYVRGSGEVGITLSSFDDVRIEGTYIAGCAAASVYAKFSQEDAPGLTLEGVVLEENDKGVDSKSIALKMESSSVANCDSLGLRLYQGRAVEILDSFVVGNGSTGVDLTLLTGTDQTEYVVSGSLVQENVGMGILVRSGGPGTVFMTDNVVLGTRFGMLVNGGGESGAVGDGIAVVAGSDGTPSTSRMDGNTVTGNARLGALVHGEGTMLDASNNEYENNGFAGSLSQNLDGTPNLVFQTGAEVVGEDAQLALTPAEPIVAGDNVALGTGGDPRL